MNSSESRLAAKSARHSANNNEIFASKAKAARAAQANRRGIKAYFSRISDCKKLQKKRLT